ncbi:alanine racemase [Brevibacterium linens]|uniref:alanine racemase n=1 Tax=Brevibacterium linens TaxID=1703 RepID=UPI000C77F3A5|nr:alanine racemase [Brevibacterium linens]AZU01480.1 alanine racemase [Brevibacterium linens]KAB1948493.1 alanine racemase [Brevibacterium linens ATCC 9172]
MTSFDIPEALVRAEIDEAALRDNAAVLADRLSPARLKCVVKANAYGHGIDLIAPALFSAGWREFCVATIPEALRLRSLLGPEAQILAWLYGPTTDLDEAVRADIELGISTVGALERLAEAARRTGVTARAHLKIDTGLGRNGLSPEALVRAFDWLRRHADDSRTDDAEARAAAADIRVVGIMSHFAVADEPERPETAAQSAVFSSAHGQLRAVLDAADGRLGESDDLDVHIVNSPGALTLGPCPGTSARVGLALYGLSPLDDGDPTVLGLRPVMRLVSTVINLKDIPAGHGASYGLTFTAATDTRFALVPGGYGDGLPRAASNRAEVAIRGRRYPVVGRIAMDQMIIDIGAGNEEVAIGDEVVIFGPGGPSAAEWGTWANTINYEIVTQLSARVDRVARKGDGR